MRPREGSRETTRESGRFRELSRRTSPLRTLDRSNGPMSATLPRRRANERTASVTVRAASHTLGCLRQPERRTKTRRDISDERSGRPSRILVDLAVSCVSCVRQSARFSRKSASRCFVVSSFILANELREQAACFPLDREKNSGKGFCPSFVPLAAAMYAMQTKRRALSSRRDLSQRRCTTRRFGAFGAFLLV